MTDELPALAVFWEDAAFSPLEIAEAARGICRPVFVLGWSRTAPVFPRRLLERLGPVVDVPADGGADMPVALSGALDRLDVAGVIVFTDPPQRLAATVARHLGLDFHSVTTASALSDKWAQRRALQAAGVPVPGYWPLTKAYWGDQAQVAGTPPVTETGPVVGTAPGADDGGPAAEISFPAVLKPRRGAGSRDTFLVRDAAELATCLAQSADDDLLVEQYIEDCEPQVSGFGSDLVSVESLVEDGEAHHVAITGRFRFEAPFRDTGGFVPSDIPAEHAAAVCEVASAAANALGVVTGALHTEIKLSPAGPVVVEVNGRVGGNVTDLLARVGSPNLTASAMRLALGQQLPSEERVTIGPAGAGPTAVAAARTAAARTAAVGFVRFYRAPYGAKRLSSVDGVEVLSGLPGVQAVSVNRRAGDTIDWGEGLNADHIVAVKGVVPDHGALAEIVARMDASVALSFDAD